MRPRTIYILTAIAAMTSCTDATGPERIPATPKSELVDARNGGATNFYFLPPVAPASTYAGTFDGTRSPIVEICPLTTANQCGALVARFTTEAKGPERIRADVHAKHYIVNWKTKEHELSLNTTYRIRVLDGSVELGHADARMVKKEKDAKSLPEGIVGVVLGSTLPIKFRISSGGSGPAVRLEIHPGTFILPGAEQEQVLEVRAFDAQGRPAGGTVVWESSNQSVMTVSADGIAHAVAGTGSAQITARIGTVSSPPALGLVTQPAAGALLVSDDQIDGSIVPVDAAAAYQPGWQYRVRLIGVTPTVGQILISTGDSPVGGRVVGVTQVDGETEVTLALLSLAEMFPTLSIDESISLDQSEVQLLSSVAADYTMVHGTAGTIDFMPRQTGSFSSLGFRNTVSGIGGSIQNNAQFSLGPFECEVKNVVGGPVLNSIGAPSVHVDPNLSLDLTYTPAAGLQKLLVNGGLTGTISFNSSFPAAMEEKIECKAHVATLILPISGPLSLFIGGQIPLGVGFELGGKLTLANVGVDASMTAGVTMSLGIDCTASCHADSSLSGNATGAMKPILPATWTDAKNELAGTAFAYAELAIGNAFIQALQFKTVEAKGGLKQEFKLASKLAQASDAAYASSFQLSFDVEAGTGSSLNAVAALLGFNLAELKITQSFPLARSPIGTLQITPSTVTPGTATQVGQQATFTVTLDPVDYLGAYAVEGIEIRWMKNGVLDPGRPGCTDLAAAQGQTTFTCSTDFLDTTSGDQIFYAFVKTRIFGIPIPIPLEIANDSHATVRVATAGAVTVSGSGHLTTAVGANGLCSKSLNYSGSESSKSLSDSCASAFTDIFTVNFRPDTITYNVSASQTYSYDATGSPTNLRVTMNGTSTASVSESKPTGFLPTTARAPQSRNVCFTVPVTVSYSLSGSISGSAKTIGYNDKGRAELALFQMSTGAILYQADAGYNNFFGEDYPTTVSVSKTGSLTAGNYCLVVDADTLLDYPTPRSAAAAFNIVLQLTP